MKRKHISNFQYDRHEIERALFFLSNALQKSGHNAKPVFLHSIQVAEMLWERDFPQDIVIAAILHDVIEDTDVTIQEIECKFGQQVMRYVDVLTISSKMSSSLLFAKERIFYLTEQIFKAKKAEYCTFLCFLCISRF